MKPGPAISVRAMTPAGSSSGADDAFRGLPWIGALAAGEHHGEVGGEIAMARVARALEDELDAVGAEPRGDPGELGAEQVAHSPAALPGFLTAGLASALDGLASVLGVSLFDSPEDAAGFSVSGFRGPFPSLP